jgi:hypothetical protein
METGLIVIVVVVILFYLRLFMIRGRRKKEEKREILKHMRQGKKGAALPDRNTLKPLYKVTRWYLLVPGVVVMFLGIAMRTQVLLIQYKEWWWVPVALGGIMFIFSFD